MYLPIILYKSGFFLSQNSLWPRDPTSFQFSYGSILVIVSTNYFILSVIIY